MKMAGRQGLHVLLLAGLVLLHAQGLLSARNDSEDDRYRRERERMVSSQIESRGIKDPAVLAAMKKTPRHMFVPDSARDRAYEDHPLPIGEGQTISQPYIVALMTETLKLSRGSRVLEIGTGSGYQAAVLAEITDHVYSMEIKEKLFEQAARTLRTLGYGQVETRQGDGWYGWKEAAPFDAIMITAAVDHIPPPLLEQLKDGGRLVLPLGNPFGYQNLVLVTKDGKDYRVKQVTGVLFVPMTGKALEQRE